MAGAAKSNRPERGKLRYGVLTAFEEDTLLEGELNSNPFDSVVQDGREFGVARLLYEDTSTGARRGFGWLGTIVEHPQSKAIVQSLDGHYLSRQGKWNTDAQLMYSVMSMMLPAQVALLMFSTILHRVART